jgi:hypothetical protein
MNRTSYFRKENLPSAKTFFERELGRLSRPNRRGWTQARCPDPGHQSKSGRSFAVNIDTGGFFCFGCGKRGGGLIDFVMQRDHCSFKTACQELGVWREADKPGKPIPRILVPYLRMDFVINGVPYHAELPDEPRTELQQARTFFAAAEDRLTELLGGETEKFEGEEEVHWGILANSWELIQMELEVRDGK